MSCILEIRDQGSSQRSGRVGEEEIRGQDTSVDERKGQMQIEGQTGHEG